MAIIKILVIILLLVVSTSVFFYTLSIDYKTQHFSGNASQLDRTKYFTPHTYTLSKDFYVQILDFKGQLVLSKKVGKKNLYTSIDVSAFNSEIYFTALGRAPQPLDFQKNKSF